MVILGVLLMVAAAVVLVDMGVVSKGTTDVHLLGWHIGMVGPGRYLLIGTAIGAVLAFGLTMVMSGQLRSRRKRRERDRTLKGTRAENQRLAQQLEEQRAVVVPPAEPTAPAATAHERDVAADARDDRPAEAYPEGAEYVLGSRYPQGTSAVHTPPAPPESAQR
jgi:hypothetical protein